MPQHHMRRRLLTRPPTVRKKGERQDIPSPLQTGLVQVLLNDAAAELGRCGVWGLGVVM